jgi:hypothetical protein
MPRFYLNTPPKSVTYVLNLLCYLGSEPAPFGEDAEANTRGRVCSPIHFRRDHNETGSWKLEDESWEQLGGSVFDVECWMLLMTGWLIAVIWSAGRRSVPINY